MTATLDTLISALSATGKRCAKKLEGLGILTCRDLLWHFPVRFEDFSRVVPIADLAPQSSVTVRGKIVLLANRRSFRRRMIVTEGLISDDTGSVKVMWFNQPFIIKNLVVGDMVSVSGKTSGDPLDMQFVSPSYEKIKAGVEATHTARLVPVYPTTEGVTQKQLRSLIASALDQCGEYVVEWLPNVLLEEEDFLPLLPALRAIHFPEAVEEWESALRRFQFEELFILQMLSMRAKAQLESTRARSIADEGGMVLHEGMAALPFVLTDAQKMALGEILVDMARSVPMNRLLEGDVGSGKTVVAALAAFVVVRSGGQAAIMAPTELLARQHFVGITKWWDGIGVRIALLTSSHAMTSGWVPVDDGRADEASKKPLSAKKERQRIVDAIARGEIDIVIGTHALIQDAVSFAALDLVVVDEQHRFGVGQRKMLREKNREGLMPHLLSMTATPIPRSLTLALYGDLDISLLQSMPQGRKAIVTKLVPDEYRAWTYDFVRKQVASGYAAFVICPLVDPSEVGDRKSATAEYARLTKEVFPDLRVGLVHGKMKATERNDTLRAMLEREVDVLVATSVVEVGIDIPHATVMLIEGAEGFGLAQLHQFRGRVGRSDAQSYCFLLPTEGGVTRNARLEALVESTDGFALAEKDLALRGPGEVYGTRQSGELALKLADITNVVMIKSAREWAGRYFADLEAYPEMMRRVDAVERAIHWE